MTPTSAIPGPSALAACHALSNLAGTLAKRLYRAPLSDADLRAIDRGVASVGIWWAWEFAHFLKGCQEFALEAEAPLSFKKIRNSQTFISLIYPKSLQDERALSRSTEARVARALLANRFVDQLLQDLDWWILDALTAPTVTARYSPTRAALRACDLLERTVSHFIIVESQWLEAIRKQPQRIIGHITNTVHSRDFYEAARQNLFRDLPANVFYDYEPHVAVLAFRTALERKIRSAIAVRSFRAPRNQQGPLKRACSWIRRKLGKERSAGRNESWIINMSDLFAMWSELKLNILAAGVDVGQLRRFYYWSNQVVHAANRASLSEIWFALEHTMSLFRLVRTKRGFTNTTITTSLSAADQEVVVRRWLGVPEAWEAEILESPQ